MRRSQRGGATLEIVIMAPFVLLLLMLIIAFARFAQTESLVDQAARDGARAATAQNSRGDVDQVINRAVEDAMTNAPGSCRQTVVADPELSQGAYQSPKGDPEDAPLEIVTVTVSCDVDFSDLAGIPLGSLRVDRTFTSPLDRHRGYVE